MPTNPLRLLAASGLLVLATFASARAQEPAVDPNYQDIPLPEQTAGGFEAVTPLVQPEVDYENCQNSYGSWHPPIYYPSPEIYCPTGNVHRDWLREMTVGFTVNRRQRMLEKDYEFRMQNGHQPVCCPPHSCWGHSCDCCPGVGCKKRGIIGISFEQPCESSCGIRCGMNQGYQTLGHEVSAMEPSGAGIELTEYLADGGDGFFLVSDEQSGSSQGAIVQAGCCEISDGCANGHCQSGRYCQHGRHCKFGLHGRNGWWFGNGYYCPLHHRWCFGDDCDECDDDCDDDECFLSGRCLFSDGPGGWRREIPPFCHYYMAYPVNPYHFDQRDGRIYAAQGYGHPVGVPLAPNVEHTYNYGWGLPSSRLTPVSRMPGAPGVANPAVPGAAGPGIFPPGFSAPAPIPGMVR